MLLLVKCNIVNLKLIMCVGGNTVYIWFD